MNEQLSFDLTVQTGDAVKNVDALQVSIDDLTKVMGDNVKTGSKLVKTFADNAKQVSVLGKEVADLAKIMADSVKVTEENTAATMLGAEATEKATTAQRLEAEELRSLIATLKETAVETRNVAAADEEMAAASKAASGEKQKAESLLSKIGNLGTPEFLKAASWSALAVGGVAYEAIKHYASFNAVLTQSITQAGRAPDSLPFLTNEAVSIAKNTGIHLNDVANILYRVSSATSSWNNGLGATNGQLAQMATSVANLNLLGGVAGGAPSEQSARVIGAVMNANLPGVGNNAENAAAWINASVGAGDIKQSEFISAMGRGLLASLSAHKISASSGSSFVDLLTTLGTPGSTAGQYAKTALTLMTSPSAQGSAAMAMIGVSTGQLGALLSQKDGITAAAEYLHQSLQRFNPSSFNETVTTKNAQGQSVVLSGAAAARAQLEKWATGTLPSKVIDAWAAGQLGSMTAAELGTTKSGANGTAVSGAQWLNTLQNLIITKAYGGSRSSATIDALVNNTSQIAGIQKYIDANSTQTKLKQDIAIANATPQAQFRRMGQTFMGEMVQLGKEITPTALSLSKVLLSVVDGLLKMKFVLVPLVTAIGALAAGALAVKGARVLEGGFRFFGAASGALSRVYGRIAGVGEEGLARTRPASFFETLSRGTGMFGPASDKMNIAADKMLEAAGISRESSAAGAMGGMGGGGEKGIFKKLFSRGEKTALSDVEKAAMHKGESAIVGDAAGFVEKAAMHKGESAIVGDAAGFVEKEGVGLLSRFAGAGLGDIVGGALGGPVGMLLMSTVGPMLMPYISKGVGSAISGVGHFFGNLFGGGGTSAPKVKAITPIGNVMQGPMALKSQILVDQANLTNLSQKIAAGTATTKDYAAYYTTQSEVRNLQNQQKLFSGLSASAANQKVKLANLANYKNWTAEVKGLANFASSVKSVYQWNMDDVLTYNQGILKGLPSNVVKAFTAIMNNGNLSSLQKSQEVESLSQSTSALLGKNIDQLPIMQALKNAKQVTSSQLSVDSPTAALIAQSSKKNLGVGQATADYATLTRLSIKAALDSREDTKAAAAQRLAGNVEAAAALTKAAAKLKSQSEASAAAATNVAQKNNLNQQNMNALASAVETSFAKAATSIGLTPAGMSAAFSTALGHGGLSGAVSAILRNGMSGKAKN
jgi:hypothetical protein